MMASQVPEQSGGRHQRQNASQLTRAILARQGEAFTAVFLLQRPKPAGVLIDDGDTNRDDRDTSRQALVLSAARGLWKRLPLRMTERLGDWIYARL